MRATSTGNHSGRLHHCMMGLGLMTGARGYPNRSTAPSSAVCDPVQSFPPGLFKRCGVSLESNDRRSVITTRMAVMVDSVHPLPSPTECQRHFLTGFALC